jgi:hypothetical protein
MAYTPRINPGGNYCGHDPANPVFVSAVNPHTDEAWTPERKDGFGHKRKASWFYDVDAALKQFYFYPKMLPGLGILQKDDGTSRIRRSEWREDAAALLSALTHHIELASINWKEGFCRVGMPTKDGFFYYDSKFWMSKTGLSESRLKRAFGKLQGAGYITRTRRWIERDKGKFKGLATSTLVHLDLYREMGLIDGLKNAAAHAYTKLKESADNLQTSVSRMLRCAVESLKPKAKAPKVSGLGKPTDYPPTSINHWLCQLPTEGQRQAFHSRYCDLFLQYGENSDVATVLREAFISIKRQV